MIEVNGKVYPLWSQFVEQKSKWIGGDLEDFGDSSDRYFNNNVSMKTIITDIRLEPNSPTSAFFLVVGKDFSCGFDVQYGGISGKGEKGWLTFEGYGGHTWRIRENKNGN